MIEIKFSAASSSELRATIRDYLGLDAETGPQTVDAAVEKLTTQRQRKPKEDAKPAPEPTVEAADDEPEAAPELTYDGDIKPLILKVSKDIGEDDARSLLGAFKGADGKACAGGKAVQAKDYATFKRMAEKLIADKADAPEELA